ncbi:hypothetical protein Nepgr_000437 [Nepenthes gracilis]|uniref:Uncharacterized protein n=1 Tax=Nepenthes gracilis TaxID=150966 RepID=A0AAD3P596_NEPGR|nr:hypothetical protein Nepgr_000437 [Nepenthes gracilis]
MSLILSDIIGSTDNEVGHADSEHALHQGHQNPSEVAERICVEDLGIVNLSDRIVSRSRPSKTQYPALTGNSSNTKSLSRSLPWLPRPRLNAPLSTATLRIRFQEVSRGCTVNDSKSHSQRQLFRVLLTKTLVVTHPVELKVPPSAPENGKEMVIFIDTFKAD